MHMDGWEDFLHFSFLGEHVLFEILPLNSFTNFFWGSFLTILICLAERSLTFAIAKQCGPFPSARGSRLRKAIWKASLYWVVTVLRLTYMLIAMSYNIALILVTATALAAGQLVIEYMEAAPGSLRDSYQEPLLSPHPAAEDFDYLPGDSMDTRPRSRSRPGNIFIRPNESNIFRADAAALEMGITGDAELAKGQNSSADKCKQDGEDKAGEILASSSRLKFPS